MSRRKKRLRGGNPAQRMQVDEGKHYGPFLTYLRSLTFIKNTLIGCFYPFILMLFPFAKVAIERIGLWIAPAHFCQKIDSLNYRLRSLVDMLYWLLITLMILPLTVIYIFQLHSDKHRPLLWALSDICPASHDERLQRCNDGGSARNSDRGVQVDPAEQPL